MVFERPRDVGYSVRNVEGLVPHLREGSRMDLHLPLKMVTLVFPSAWNWCDELAIICHMNFFYLGYGYGIPYEYGSMEDRDKRYDEG